MKKISLIDDIKKSYVDYALSVIVGRALPDVRDGLKPVHRRILYAMYGLGLAPEKGYRKCARVVGEVLGKYHPHGDSSVYDALVRMAQDFSMRYILVDGHGNFGSIDGDSSASMRYTESRMQKMTLEMLRDIDKNTVEFIPNFDGEEKEPTVLPSRYPNLLVNGSSGIAVGYATNIPPHNLNNVIDTVIHQINNPNCTNEELSEIIVAPDFPTGGTILNPKDMKDLYTNGKGKIIIRAKYHIENIDGKQSIVITEIPYGVNKSSLLDSLVELTSYTYKEEKVGRKTVEVKIPPRIENKISELTDESDVRLGLRIIITLEKGTNLEEVLKTLFKYSKLQTTFTASFNAVCDNNLLEELSLKNMNDFYIKHQINVITNRSKFNLDKAMSRKHILDGLLIALNNIEEIITIIKTSKTTDIARNTMIDKFGLTEKQTQAIFEMKLRRLSMLESDKIEEEYTELVNTIEYLNGILSNENELLKVIIDELLEIKDKYGDERRTNLEEDTLGKFEKIIPDYNCRIVYTNQGFIKKVKIKSDSHKLKQDDFILGDISSNNVDTLMIFDDKGNRYSLPCNDLGEPIKPSVYGHKLNSAIKLGDNKIIKIVSIPPNPKGYIVAVYENGKTSKVNINSFSSNNKILSNCYNTESKLIDIDYIQKDVDILTVSSEGKVLIFNTDRINAKGSRSTQGNISMKLNDDHTCVNAIINVSKDNKITLHTSKGKDIYIMLDDVSVNDNKNWCDYLSGKTGNQGNFVYNTRNNGDLVTKVTIE